MVDGSHLRSVKGVDRTSTEQQLPDAILSSQQGVRVLVVDDERETAELVQRLLTKRLGADVTVACTVPEARGLFDAGFDIITLDYQMPECDGITLLKEIVRLPDSPSVVMVTGHGDESTAAAAFREGACGYVVKDSRMANLLPNAVTSALLERNYHEVLRQRQLMSELLDGVSDAVIIRDPEMRISYWNKGAERMYGIPASDALGKLSNELLETSNPDGSTPEEALGQLVETGDFRGELIYHSPAGAVIADVSEWTLKDEAGSPVAHISINRDVTDLKRLDRQLAQILDRLPDAVFVTDRDAHAVYVNEKMKELLGAEVPIGSNLKDLRGKLYKSYIAGTDEPYPLERAPIFVAMRGEASIVDDVEMDSTGGRIPLEVSGAPVLGDDGKVLYAVSITKDISERKLAEEALARSEKQFRDLVSTARSIILKCDTTGTITFVNDFGSEFFGFDKGELVGKKAVGTIVPEVDSEGQDLAAMIDDLVHDPDSYSLNINENVKKDGTRVWISWTNKATYDEDGHLSGTLTIGNDITALKMYGEKLFRLNAELDAYAHVVSHDLKSPLSAIALANAIVSSETDRVDDADARREIAEASVTIGRSIQKAFSLVNDLLALAAAGQVPLTVEEVRVATVVRDVVEEKAQEIRLRATAVRLDDDMGTLRVHPMHVYQVFSNLIGNAIKHNTAEEPEVVVSYLGKDPGGAHRFRVSNNGPGISEDQMESMFVPFSVRADGTRTGMGLSIVRKIVDLYGGSLAVSSDGDTVFEVSLRDWEDAAVEQPGY